MAIQGSTTGRGPTIGLWLGLACFAFLMVVPVVSIEFTVEPAG